MDPNQFIEQLKTTPRDIVAEINDRHREETARDYELFSSMLDKGICSICNNSIKTISVKNPCLHWLLRPNCFKKKMFPLLYKEYSYFRISSYIRWVASTEGIIQNINDIPGNKHENYIDSFTARYKHITWSIQCSESDYIGHKTTNYGAIPHYHIQMRLNGKQFINYGDFHIPFHQSDIDNFNLFKEHPDLVRYSHGPGLGLRILSEGNQDSLQKIIDNSVTATDHSNAPLRLQTIVIAKDGESFSEDIINEVYKESNATGKTLARVAREKLKNALITTIIEPTDNIPESMGRPPARNKTK